MNQLIEALEATMPPRREGATARRYVPVKEEHAELVKREVRIIWGDYFKPEHLEKYKDLHALTLEHHEGRAARTGRRSTRRPRDDLLAATQKFAEMFWDTQGRRDEEPALEPGRRRRARRSRELTSPRR